MWIRLDRCGSGLNVKLFHHSTLISPFHSNFFPEHSAPLATVSRPPIVSVVLYLYCNYIFNFQAAEFVLTVLSRCRFQLPVISRVVFVFLWQTRCYNISATDKRHWRRGRIEERCRGSCAQSTWKSTGNWECTSSVFPLYCVWTAEDVVYSVLCGISSLIIIIYFLYIPSK